MWLYELCSRSSQDGFANSQSVKGSNLNSFSLTFFNYLDSNVLSINVQSLFMIIYVENLSILHNSEKIAPEKLVHLSRSLEHDCFYYCESI